MAERLPDEILAEILSPILDVEDRLFADTSAISPFSLRSYSNSAVLIVCRKWLRVCTPLLYNVVILRSTAQAQALAFALTKNKFLGLFIKKLRLEGGFGASMRKVLPATPNIRDIVLSLSISSHDSVVGLVKGLQLINPTRVIVLDNRYQSNMQVRQLYEKLCECIPIWTNMKSIDLSMKTIMRETVLQALKSSHSIELVHVPSAPHIVSSLTLIVNIPSLKAIEVKCSGTHPYFQRRVEEYPRLAGLIRYQGLLPSHNALVSTTSRDQADTLVDSGPLQTTNPFYSPMSSASPDVQDVIWSRILAFALKVDTDEENTPCNLNPTRAFLPLVSKKFKTLATPLLYHYSVILGSAAFWRFGHQLKENPSLGQHVRCLFMSLGRQFLCSGALETMQNILSRTTGLVWLHSTKVELASENNSLPLMDWNMLVGVVKSSGSTLVAFHNIFVRKPAIPQAPSVFDGFVKLRSLRWCSTTKFVVNHSTSPTCLATLESIHFTLYDKTFADVLCRMELPSLSDVVFCGSVTNALPFLVIHGPKIRSLELQLCENHPIFDLCPNVTILFLGSRSISTFDPTFFDCKTGHHPLAEIGLKVRFGRKTLKNFYPAVNLSRFPALREIRATYCVWPVNQREIETDFWHKWSDILSKQGIKLTDASGRHWRPRLESQRR